MENRLCITNGNLMFFVAYDQAIDIELKLNVSKFGKTWSHIGDHLFQYGTRTRAPTDTLSVTKEQYEFLVDLHLEPRKH
jgi:hypothetical protein